LVALCLQHCGSEQGDLLALFNAAEYLRVIEIADSQAHHARRVFVALFHEHEHRAAGPPCSSRSRSCCSATTTLPTTTSETAGTAGTAGTAAPAGR
jgi:hypothetical protein